MPAVWIISVDVLRRRDTILTRRSQLPWNIATRPSFSEKPCSRWNSNVMCSGRCSTQSITATSRGGGFQSAHQGEILAVGRLPLLINNGGPYNFRFGSAEPNERRPATNRFDHR